MCNQSSDQDSSLEDENQRRIYRPSSSHISTHSGTIQKKKNLFFSVSDFTSHKPEKSTLPQEV